MFENLSGDSFFGDNLFRAERQFLFRICLFRTEGHFCLKKKAFISGICFKVKRRTRGFDVSVANTAL
jgi:hypothetical protein